MITNLEAVYNLCVENPQITNDEISETVGISKDIVKTYISRLKSREYIATHLEDNKRVFEKLRPYRVSADVSELTIFKQECYKEMIDVLLEDFRNVASQKDRIEIGNVIRLLIKEF